MKKIPLAGCVIQDDSGRVLLIHRNTVRLVHWELPGGKVEAGETGAAAAKREALEELGIVVEVGEKLGETDFVDNDIAWQYSWFRAVIIAGKPHALEADKHDDATYFDLLEPTILPKSISVNIKKLIAAIKSNQVQL